MTWRVIEKGVAFSLVFLQLFSSCKKESLNFLNKPPVFEGCATNRPQVIAQLLPVGTLSLPGREMSAVTAGSKVFFLGGGETRVDIFDFAANAWSTTELSHWRGLMSVIAAGNKIFFAGGQNDDGFSTTSVDIYDVATNKWSITQLNRGADGLAAATVGNKVFFAGGNWGLYAVNTVDVYDLTTNTWSTATLSASRNLISAVSAGNKVYFTGGDPYTGSTSNVIDVYDNTTGLWSTSNLLAPRGYHTAIAVNDVLYFAGGKTSTASQATCSIETLHTITGNRTTMNLSGPISWSYNARQNAVVKNNKILFFKNDGTAESSKFDIYDAVTNTWSVGVLPFRISGASVIAANNTVYIAGGMVEGTLSDKVYRLEI